MKQYFPQSQRQTLQYEIYITFLKKKKKADVTKLVANYLQTRETGTFPPSDVIKATIYSLK